MTDREYLELAAKAAGIELRWHPDGTAYSDSRCKDYWGVWNPLTDDGDALRLAVKCNLNVCVGYGSVSACLQDDGSFHRTEEIKDDPYAATRRAIVRAAVRLKLEGT